MDVFLKSSGYPGSIYLCSMFQHRAWDLAMETPDELYHLPSGKPLQFANWNITISSANQLYITHCP